MPVIVGLCGLSGVGKSTVREYLAEGAATEGVYLGEAVLEEVRRRGLPETRDSERMVRISMRESNRAEMLARGLPSIIQAVDAGRSVVIDAILLPEEYDCLLGAISGTPIHLLKIHVGIEKRLSRLASRANRPLSLADVNARDSLELNNLRTREVFQVATHTISNEGDLDDLSAEIKRYADFIGCGR